MSFSNSREILITDFHSYQDALYMIHGAILQTSELGSRRGARQFNTPQTRCSECSSLVWVMAGCLLTTSHYLNQYCLFIYWNLSNTIQLNYNSNIICSFKEIYLKMSSDN